jgi:hypothetical protein
MQWLDNAVKQLKDHGATDIVIAQGGQGGREVFMLQFTLRGMKHKVVWPVLPLSMHVKDTESNLNAARRQAATSLYHDVKARCVAATRYGDRFGFFQFQLLPDGRTIQECSLPELSEGLPKLMSPADAGHLTG